MTDRPNPPLDPPVPPDLQAVIQAFEKILEAFPADRLALETLAGAFEQMGDHARSSQHLQRLAGVIVAEQDVAAVPGILERLQLHAGLPGVAEHILALEHLQSRASKAAHEVLSTSTPARNAADITNEVSLAWELLQGNRLTQEEYAAVVSDLSEQSSRRSDVPVSVLHVLADKGFKGLDKVIAYIAKQTGCPSIPLSSFELHPDHFSLLPADFVNRRGAIVFDLMGADALVAVLNPVDRDLQEDVRRILKRRCHFYIASAQEYDHAIGVIRKHNAAKSQAT